MNLLGIDTSTDIAFVALYARGQYYEAQQAGVRSHAHDLLPMIERVLSQAGIALNQLDGITFGQGPGSFTGLRVACSMAKGLSYGLDVPLYPVCTLSAVIWAVRQSRQIVVDASILALIDARMNQLYVLVDRFENPALVQVSYPEDIQVSDRAPLVIAGVGWQHYDNRLNAALRSRVVSTYEIYPEPLWMIQMVLHGIIDPVSADNALPLYVRNQVVKT